MRAALTLALGCGVLAYRFGFASILGAFAAGLLVRLVEVSGREPNEQFLTKLEGIGFGFLIPIFFISVGVGFNLKDLLNHPSALVEVPLFLVALLVVRGVPALLYKRVMDTRHAAAAGLLQATSADVRHRGGGDRPGDREAVAERGRRAGHRWAVVRGAVPGRGGPDTRSWPESRVDAESRTGHSSTRLTYLSKRAKSARFIVTTVPTP